MNRIADWIAGRPGAVGLALGLFTALAVAGLARLRIDDVPRSFFRSADREFALLEEVFRDFGSDDGECVILLEVEDVFEPATIADIVALDRQLSAVEGVAEVWSLADAVVLGDTGLPQRLLPAAGAAPEAFEAARQAAHGHPLVEDQLLSRDGKATLLVARLADDLQAISALRPVVGALEALLAARREAGVTVRMTGIPPIRTIIFDSIEREQTLFASIGAALGFLVGWIVFRRIGPILITSAASILSGLWALGCFGLTGQPVNILNSGLPLLIMVIALTDAVHLMIEILRSRHQGLAVDAAAHGAVRHLGLPCALTSLTTAVGFGSLAISRVDVVRDFGIVFAIAVGLSFLVVLTAVPVLSIRFLRAGPRRGFDSRPNSLHRHSERAIRFVVEHGPLVSVSGALVTAVLLVIALRLKPENRLTEATPKGSAEVQTLLDCERIFGGVLTTSVLCEWSTATGPDAETLRAVSEVQAAFDDHPLFRGSLSVVNLLQLLPGGSPDPHVAGARLGFLDLLPAPLVRRFWRPDLGRALVSARAPDCPSAVAQEAYTELAASLAAVHTRHPGVALHLTGTDFIARRNVNVMIVDFALGLGLAAFVIFGVLSAAFGSIRLGALSILPNVFPLVLTASMLAFLGLELQMTSVIAFTVCLGLAVDDTIHFVARFRRELEHCGDPSEAAVNAFLHVGRALLVTTAILLAGFVALSFSAIPTTQVFAQICCVGLVAALVGDLVFLPALLVTFPPKGHPRASKPADEGR